MKQLKLEIYQDLLEKLEDELARDLKYMDFRLKTHKARISTAEFEASLYKERNSILESLLVKSCMAQIRKTAESATAASSD